MATTTTKSAFREGVIAGLPFTVFAIPFATLFGVVATEAGLNVAQTMGFSVMVIAGASQFTAVQLISDNAPLWAALAASLAVNLRMAMYSAALVPYVGHARLRTRALMAYLMVDQAFAVAVRTYEDRPDLSPSARVAYYFGCMILICPFWYGCTLLGALVGQAIPPTWSLDFAVPVCFIALTAPLLRSGPHVLAALVAAIAALAFAWVPWSLGLIIAAGIGIVTGAQAELALRRRSARGTA